MNRHLSPTNRLAGGCGGRPRIQHGAEKAIKALVVSSDLDPPKTHNLLRLARMLAEETASRLLDVDLEDLTRWAIEGRYPGDLDEATSRDATRAVELAGQILAVAQAALESADGGQ